MAIYRINEDIRFNYGGAKNLAVHNATTDWVLITDIDHMLDLEAVEKLIDFDLAGRDNVYCFGRSFPDGPLIETRPEVRKANVVPGTILINREKFREAGGYDEDLSGHYGKDDTLLKWHLLNNHGCVFHKLPMELLCRACIYDTQPKLDRDVTRNTELVKTKIAAGNRYRPGPGLRFTWTKRFESVVPSAETAP